MKFRVSNPLNLINSRIKNMKKHSDDNLRINDDDNHNTNNNAVTVPSSSTEIQHESNNNTNSLSSISNNQETISDSYNIAQETQENIAEERIASTTSVDSVPATEYHQEDNELFIQHHSQIPIHHKSRPASIYAMSKLDRTFLYNYHRETYGKTCDDMCSICVDPLIEGLAVMRMPCGHTYHFNCLISWLGKSNTCPECRYEIETMDPIYEIDRKQRMQCRSLFQCQCKPLMHTCFFINSSTTTTTIETNMNTDIPLSLSSCNQYNDLYDNIIEKKTIDNVET